MNSFDPFKDIPVPVPSKIPSFSKTDSLEKIALGIDDYFEDIIRVYDLDIQDHLRNMYYHNENVGYDDIQRRQVYETHESKCLYTRLAYVRADHTKPNYLTMQMPLGIEKSPCIDKIVKIHELGAHVGQILVRDQKIKPETLTLRQKKDFVFFTEHSAAMAEKILIDEIPTSKIYDMCDQLPSHSKIKRDFENALISKKENGYSSHIRLTNNKLSLFGEDYTKKFMNIEAVKAFNTQRDRSSKFDGEVPFFAFSSSRKSQFRF